MKFYFQVDHCQGVVKAMEDSLEEAKEKVLPSYHFPVISLVQNNTIPSYLKHIPL